MCSLLRDHFLVLSFKVTMLLFGERFYENGKGGALFPDPRIAAFPLPVIWISVMR